MTNRWQTCGIGVRLTTFVRSAVLRIALACIFTSASAQQPTRPAPAPAPDPAAVRERAIANAKPDQPGTGPYAAEKRVEAGLPDHVVYRPQFPPRGRALGLLVFGNGSCSADGASYRQLLLEIASHGYVVIAPGAIRSGPDAPHGSTYNGTFAFAPDGKRITATTAADVIAGMDWALAENARKGSPYFGLIDPAKVAVAGHSCGGLQALNVAADPRIRAAIVLNAGTFDAGLHPLSVDRVDKSILLRLHTPLLYILGGPTDAEATDHVTKDFAAITHVPVIVADLPTGHGGTYREDNGGETAGVIVDWLAWQLGRDERAARRFVGADCGLCTDRRWTVRRKGF